MACALTDFKVVLLASASKRISDSCDWMSLDARLCEKETLTQRSLAGGKGSGLIGEYALDRREAVLHHQPKCCEGGGSACAGDRQFFS